MTNHFGASTRTPADLVLPRSRLNQTVTCNSYEDARMRQIVGFIQLACALTLGMAGGWAVHQMSVVMAWNWF
jgi:hypothetical protein